MQCYTELAPPTAVSHALNLPFLAPKANNLVVAKNSLLQIFELKSTVTEVASAANGTVESTLETEAADVQVQRTENTAKLVLAAEFPLAGTVISLARIKLLKTKSKAEALLIAFRDAKLSLVEWDPETHNLHTISIHYYENPDISGAPWAADLKDTYNFLTADPGNRCAALKFGTHNLAILPFRQSGLVEEEWLDGSRPQDQMDVDGEERQDTPYSASFVLPLTQLDPTLTHPVHLAFLYKYREPTFGIIAASRATAPSLLAQRKDILTYTVFALDLEQKASTTLLSVQGLPYDLSKVVPLPDPIGGALLVGANEIIHVDEAGRTNGVAVNELTKSCTSFSLVDQSDLALRLEGCVVESLSPDARDVLIILNDGRLAILTFRMDGKTVSGIMLRLVDPEFGGHILPVQASCAAILGRGRVFVGSEDADSHLISWTGKHGQLGRRRSQPDAVGNEDMSQDEEDDAEDDDLDDDLYGGTATTVKATTLPSEPTAPGAYTFRIHDILPSIAPIRKVIVQPLHTTTDTPGIVNTSSSSDSAGDLLLSTGRGKAGGITVLNRELYPTRLAQSNEPQARGLWAVHARKQAPKGMTMNIEQDLEGSLTSDADYDQYLVVCKARTEQVEDVETNAFKDRVIEDTIIYKVNGNDLDPTKMGDFDGDIATIDVGVLAGGTKVVQVTPTEIRTFDSELNLVEMFGMEPEEDEDMMEESEAVEVVDSPGDGDKGKRDEDGHHIVHASFADPYLLVLRKNSTVRIYKASPTGDVEEVEDTNLATSMWLSASLFKSPSLPDIYAFMLSPEGSLQIYSMSNLNEPSYSSDALSYLLPLITGDSYRGRAPAKATLTEVLAADLGDSTSKSPHLLIRTSNNDIVIYKAFHHYETDKRNAPSESRSWTTGLRWIKLAQPHLPKYSDEPAMESKDIARGGSLVALDNVNGYSCVFQRGTSPCFILKESSSAPRVIDLNGRPVKDLTSFHTSGCQRGFAYIDADDTLRISQLPAQTHYGHTGWPTRRVPLGSEIYAMAYHPRGVFVAGTGQTEEWLLPDDTYHYEWTREDIALKPTLEQGILKVYDAETWTIVDTVPLEPEEVVLCIETLTLEVSENTHERKPLIAVGTAIVHGEDLATKGNIRIFEVITVVPEPERPETNKKLRLIVKDEVKGAVSSISELGTQGFMIMAQGQKCMVRGLKEDGTLLPVAFMDMQCHVTVLKSLPNTGMLIMGDAYKGLWFTGYTEEPYKMMLFGRSRSPMEVMNAEFLPFEKQLHIIVADADMNLQVLQFDPENPRSMSGLRLLHKSTFHTGHFPVSMHLLKSSIHMPSTPDPFGEAMQVDPSQPLHQILCTTQTGTIALITPLSETSYRRLSGLATFLSNTLDNACGLNPKAFRAADNDVVGAGATRGIIDGNLLLRWGELGELKKKDGLGKIGGEEWLFAGEREVLIGRGLFGKTA